MQVRLAKLAMTDHNFVRAVMVALSSQKMILNNLFNVYAVHEFKVNYDDKDFVIDLTAHKERNKHLVYLFIVYPVSKNGNKARKDCGTGWIDEDVLNKAVGIKQ